MCGQPAAGIILGGSLQMIAMGWANIGAAVAPDAALASVASAIILMKSGQGANGASTAIAVAIPLAVAGLFLTMIARTLAVPIVHGMDAAAENADFRRIEILQWAAIFMQVIGVVEAGFNTKVLPQTMARGAIQPTGIIAGKFHGAMPANTPMGSR